jgi:hypothetical protein
MPVSLATWCRKYDSGSDGIIVKGLSLFLPVPAQPETAQQRFRDFVMNAVGPYPILGEV